MSFNLLEEKWIPVLWNSGTVSRVGIREALTQAHKIRQIAASNPMDRVAIIRFLLALLYWCKGNPPADADIVSGKSLPADWFSKLDDNKDCFNLLGEGKRFYQYRKTDGDDAKKHSANYLIQEIPTGTNLWHFRHSTDKIDGLCLGCCAMGLLRLPMFATAGGQGKPPGINSQPPTYVLPVGVSLVETLRLSWQQTPNLDLGTPGWEKPDLLLPKTGHIPLLAGLTWVPRRVWLDDPDPSATFCVSCGRKEPLVRQCMFAGIGSTQPITKAALEAFPSKIKIPKKLEKKIRFDKSDKRLILKGSMSDKERDDLIKLSDDEPYKEAVKRLYSSQPQRDWNDPHIISDSKGIVKPSNALDNSDAAAGQWAKIMVGSSCIKCKFSNCPRSRFHQMKNKSLWVVGFATTQNDKYLEAMESEIPPHNAPDDQKIQESIERIEKWQKNKLEDGLRKIMRGPRKPRKDDACDATSAVASIRPHVEAIVSAMAGELLAGGDAAWEKAAEEYRPMMEVIAKSLSPGFTSAALKRRRDIAKTLPNMEPKSEPAKKLAKKKGESK